MFNFSLILAVHSSAIYLAASICGPPCLTKLCKNISQRYTNFWPSRIKFMPDLNSLINSLKF